MNKVAVNGGTRNIRPKLLTLALSGRMSYTVYEVSNCHSFRFGSSPLLSGITPSGVKPPPCCMRATNVQQRAGVGKAGGCSPGVISTPKQEQKRPGTKERPGAEAYSTLA